VQPNAGPTRIRYPASARDGGGFLFGGWAAADDKFGRIGIDGAGEGDVAVDLAVLDDHDLGQAADAKTFGEPHKLPAVRADEAQHAIFGEELDTPVEEGQENVAFGDIGTHSRLICNL
jgi:hypothetical protein